MTVHKLTSDQENIHYEWNSLLEPRLTIGSGDEVIIETRSGEDDQLQPGDEPSAIDTIDWNRLHALTGPIYVKEAKPGATLAVTVLDAQPASWGMIMERPGAGLLRGFESYLQFFDLGDGVATFAPGISVRLSPFLGVMGVAPGNGKLSTRPPGDHGGNLDSTALTAGSTLYLPVFHEGALFSCGDGHAAQGDGEVCVTAIECAMTSRLRFELDDSVALCQPRAETPDSYISMGSGPTLEEAARQALDDMLTFISAKTGLDRADAYALASVTVDLRINQVVNEPMMGVRALLPKAVIA